MQFTIAGKQHLLKVIYLLNVFYSYNLINYHCLKWLLEYIFRVFKYFWLRLRGLIFIVMQHLRLQICLVFQWAIYCETRPLNLWFLLCRTRESLASNTSSIVESNRRQNPALSPGHIGTSSIGLPFSFRAIPEPPTTQPEKLQKSSNCLASITSVWQAAQTETAEVVEERGSDVAHHFDPRFPPNQYI